MNIPREQGANERAKVREKEKEGACKIEKKKKKWEDPAVRRCIRVHGPSSALCPRRGRGGGGDVGGSGRIDRVWAAPPTLDSPLSLSPFSSIRSSSPRLSSTRPGAFSYPTSTFVALLLSRAFFVRSAPSHRSLLRALSPPFRHLPLQSLSSPPRFHHFTISAQTYVYRIGLAFVASF